MLNSPARYIDSIDGLRAIAVIAVVLYHLNFTFLPGGFVGVDVFFVISGYLITGLIVRQHQAKVFSLTEFYRRRIRRLLPALVVVLLCTLALAPLVNTPRMLVELSHSAASVATFVSNIYFWQSDNYFSDAAELKPLLHTWSLGVEEQFYLLFPVLLLAILKLPGRFQQLVLLALLFASFGCSVGISTEFSSLAFYMLPTRLWEFCAGAALALQLIDKAPTQRRATSDVWSTLGLGLMIYAITRITRFDVFPGYIAAIPVLATVLLLAGAADARNIVTRLLNNRVLRYIGRISYSLYLWHWVLVALFYHGLVQQLGEAARYVMLAVTMVLAAGSYHWIEMPFRLEGSLRQWLNLPKGLAIMAACALLALGYGEYFQSIVAQKGNKSKLESIFDRMYMRVPACQFKPDGTIAEDDCVIGDHGGKKTFLVWGDSHGSVTLEGLDLAGKNRGWRGLNGTYLGCPPITNIFTASNRQRCSGDQAAGVAAFLAEAKIDKVFLIARWTMYQTGWISDGALNVDTHFLSDQQELATTAEDSARVLARNFASTLAMLQALNIPTVILAPTPELPRPKGYKVGDAPLSRATYLAQRQPFEQLLDELAASYHFTVLDPADILCPDSQCKLFSADKQLYLDDNHLTSTGSISLSPLFESMMR